MRMTEEEYNILMARRSASKPPNSPSEPTLTVRQGKGKGNKYSAQKVEIDGIVFHSKKEGARYQQLKMLERSGQISGLALQQPFELAPSVTIKGRKKPPLKYIADFTYYNKDDLVQTVEDCKGFRDTVYKIKRHLMKSVHNIDIWET